MITTLRRNGLACAVAAVLASGCVTAPQYKNSGRVLPTTLPFSEAVEVGRTLYVSGQIGNLPGTLKLAPGGVKAETKQVMENIKTSVEAHGYAMKDLIKCTVMLADIGEWNAFNEVYREYFDAGRFPVRSAFGVSGLAFNARVELECTAAR